MLKLKKKTAKNTNYIFYLNQLGFFAWAASHKKLNIGEILFAPLSFLRIS
jgi:hypothetical protein